MTSPLTEKVSHSKIYKEALSFDFFVFSYELLPVRKPIVHSVLPIYKPLSLLSLPLSFFLFLVYFSTSFFCLSLFPFLFSFFYFCVVFLLFLFLTFCSRIQKMGKAKNKQSNKKAKEIKIEWTWMVLWREENWQVITKRLLYPKQAHLNVSPNTSHCIVHFIPDEHHFRHFLFVFQLFLSLSHSFFDEQSRMQILSSFCWLKTNKA